MISQNTPVVMCVVCPACGANPGKYCQEFGRKLVAHKERVAQAQAVFERTAVRLRAWVDAGAPR